VQGAVQSLLGPGAMQQVRFTDVVHTRLAQIARLGPTSTLSLKIPTRSLNLARNLGHPCTTFIIAAPRGSLARASAQRPLAPAAQAL
jgi:hypothetical protein